jgi:SNF2 family DNA or RNA helicase
MPNIIVSARHRVVGVPFRSDVAHLFPRSRPVTFEGNNVLLVTHGVAETLLLRQLGMDCPAPIASWYDYRGGSPFDVQRRTCELLTMNTRAYVLNGMGTGKSKAALWAWDFLRQCGIAKKLLICAPLSTLNFTWAKEVFDTLPGIRTQVLYGDKARRLKRLADPEAQIYIINHDGIGTIFDQLVELVTQKVIDTLVLDELAVYRNGSSQRTKTIGKLAEQMQWVWGMTGSPTPHAPTDAWAQCRIITPHTVPRRFKWFREKTMLQVSQFKYVPKRDATDHVFEAMQPAVRYTLDDVVELPEMVERQVDVDMGPVQAKVYAQMENEAYVMTKSGEITAMNQGAVLNKLLQISTGWVYTRDHRVVALDNTTRLQRLVDDVLAANEKVIVFVPFKHALAGIKARLDAEEIECVTVSGDTPKGERDGIFQAFQNTERYHCLVAHPACMAHGLTLTAATTIIWFAPIQDLDIFDQANARIRRIGQRHRQQILMYQATKAERQAYMRLRSKQQVQNLLLDMFASTTTA